MHKTALCFLFVVLAMCLKLVICYQIESDPQQTSDYVLPSEITDVGKDARYKKKKYLLHLWGWHALALAYWIKVKLVVVAFFVGAAVFVGLRYIWPTKCSGGDIHDGPIYYDHPHFFPQHDHTPYSVDHSDHFDHSVEHGSFEPYSAYESSYGSITSATAPDIHPTAPETHRVGRRSVRQTQQTQRQQHYVPTEEQITEFMFAFLGLDSTACRRRFICEMEFRSKENQLTGMAFRIMGRPFFGKYLNARNKQSQATNFAECAVVNAECVFIEQNLDDEAEQKATEVVQNLEAENSNKVPDPVYPNKNSQNSVEDNLVTNTNMEQENALNLRTERRDGNVKRRRNGRDLDAVAGRMTQLNLY